MTLTRTACEGVIGKRAGAFGFEPVLCTQIVAVHEWLDDEGQRHAACVRHIADVRRRFPEPELAEPKWLHEQPESADPITAAKSWSDAGWTEAELREAFGS